MVILLPPSGLSVYSCFPSCDGKRNALPRVFLIGTISLFDVELEFSVAVHPNPHLFLYFSIHFGHWRCSRSRQYKLPSPEQLKLAFDHVRFGFACSFNVAWLVWFGFLFIDLLSFSSSFSTLFFFIVTLTIPFSFSLFFSYLLPPSALFRPIPLPLPTARIC